MKYIESLWVTPSWDIHDREAALLRNNTMCCWWRRMGLGVRMNLWTAFPGWTRRRQLISVINEWINKGLKYGLKLKVTFIFPSKDTLMAPYQLDYDADKKSVIGIPFGSPTLYSLLYWLKYSLIKEPLSLLFCTTIHRSLNLGCIYFYGSMLMAFDCQSSCLVSEGYSGTCCCFIIVGAAAAGHHLPFLLLSPCPCPRSSWPPEQWARDPASTHGAKWSRLLSAKHI